jgi:hypothetical protein
MAILVTGNSFATGNQVTAATLNAAVNNATFVTGSSGATDDNTLSIDGSGRIYVKDLGISSAKLASNSVTTVKITDANVTPAKLSAGAPSWTSSTLNVAGSLDFSAISTTATPGTYGRSGTTVTISMTGHGMTTGMVGTFTFNSGTGGAATGGTYVVTVSDANTFTITDTVSGTITGSPACSRTSYYGTSTVQGSQTVAGNLTVSKNASITGNASVTGDLSVGGSTVRVLTRGTVVTTTGGTSIDFTSIPSWVKRITIMFNGVSTNGTDDYLVQIGDSGGVENTGYTSCGGDYGGVVASTAGFIMTRTTTAASLVSGSFFLCNITGNTWVASGDVCHDTIVASFAGTKTLSDVLDRVRITTVGGVNTFDAVSINIMYE